MSDVAPELLAILRCPRCLGVLEPEPDAMRCDACHLRYPVRDGIPLLLLSDATATQDAGDAAGA